MLNNYFFNMFKQRASNSNLDKGFEGFPDAIWNAKVWLQLSDAPNSVPVASGLAECWPFSFLSHVALMDY